MRSNAKDDAPVDGRRARRLRSGMSTRLALLLAASLACNHIPDEQGGMPTPNTLENFPDQFMRALCTSFLDCPLPVATGWNDRAPPGFQARCEAAVGPSYRHHLRRLVAAAREGRARFNAEEATRCYSAVLHACTTDPELLLERYCGRAFEGTVALHAPCRLTAECAGDTFCRTTGTPCGTCEPRAALGASCLGGYDRCARPASGWSECAGDGRVLTCVAARFASTGVLAPLGAPCGTRRAADGTIERLACALGGRCDAAEGAMGTCRGALAPGAPCTASDRCAEGGGCFAQSGRSVCVVPTFATAVGDACGTNGTSPYCDPLVGLRCESGRCAAVRDASGAPGCDWQNPWGQCPAGQICRRATSRCEAPLADGTACNVDPECASGWCERSGPTPRCVRGTC